MSDAIRPVFPFSALLGQPQLQLALTLIAIDPLIGGLLIDGPRGTAKSTSARALAELLPGGTFVTLPLGATEEMLIGSLSIDAALQAGKVTFSPGLLAKAHDGVLYVDEVNLLPDVLVDQLLDVSASGVNFIERDGVSHRHAARFALIGTMNADEGELRPQLQDRFGLALSLSDYTDQAMRVDIVKARLAFDSDPDAFRDRFAESQARLRDAIAAARLALPNVIIDDALITAVSGICLAARVEGLRADLVIVRSACALAAWNGDACVTMQHVEQVAPLALHHRKSQHEPSRQPPAPQEASKPSEPPRSRPDDAQWGAMAPSPVSALAAPTIQPPAQKKKFLSGELRGLKSRAGPSVARRTTSGTKRGSHRVHWVRTLAAKGPETLRSEHLRFRPGVSHVRTLHCLLIDCSASMLQSQQLAAAKGMLMQLIQMAYDQQADIAIVGFAGAEARVFVGPTRARPPTSLHAEAWLQPVRGGGATPLGRGVATASRLLAQAKQAQSQQSTWLWMLTDGRTTESPARPAAADSIVVVDCERSRIRLQGCLALARRWSAHYMNLAGSNANG